MIRAWMTVMLLVASVAHGDVDGNLFSSAKWRVSMAFPLGWDVSEAATYPGILATASHSAQEAQAQMTLSAQKTRPEDDLRSYVERNRKVLRRMGAQVTRAELHETGALVVDSSFQAGGGPETRQVRQAFIVKEGIAYVLTLAAPRRTFRQHQRNFDEAVKSISIAPPQTLAPIPAAPPAETPSE